MENTSGPNLFSIEETVWNAEIIKTPSFEQAVFSYMPGYAFSTVRAGQ